MPNIAQKIGLALTGFAVLVVFCTPATAASLDVPLSCENGQTYVLRPHGVTVDGDLVTGYLLRVHHQTHYMRLIPMGEGYRYSGVGIWLDGMREAAVLNFGPNRAVPCRLALAGATNQ
jgi:hypothetical protein